MLKENQYLEGLQPHMPQAFERLAEIFECQVFELCKSPVSENGSDYFVPYMMNDALEYYLILKDCRVVGEYQNGKETETTGQIVEEEQGYVLIVRQGVDNVVTLHFREIEESVACYQYHRIGHFWVKGEEQWRQLVYMVGTIYDKYEYLGEEFCNQKELDLLHLIGFAPFRHWSPVHESLEERYPATYEGIDVMEQLAEEANDTAFVKMIRFYRKFPSRKLENILSKRLLSPKRETLYRLIFEKVSEASGEYQKRDYGKDLNKMIEKKRKEVHDTLLAKGFHGAYPEYQKNNTHVFVVEEHPFTIMEFEDFVFRVHFMVSECGKLQKIEKNCGFFKGRGRRGYVLSEIGEL